MTFNSVKEFEDWIETGLQAVINGDKINMTPTEERLYQVGKDNLGQHLTLNNSVPPEVGCCECASRLFQLAGISVPTNGIAGTPAMAAWLLSNPDFLLIDAPEQGAVVIEVTSTGNGTVEGHIGMFAAFGLMYVNDWGILSNDSNTGTLREQWNWTDWQDWYEKQGGLKRYIFRPL